MAADEPSIDDLGSLHRDILRLTDVPRGAGTIAFLLGSPELKRTVLRALGDLKARHLVADEDNEMWRCTELGIAALRRADQWEMEVEDVFELSGRPRPVLACRLRRGVVYANDFFRVEDGRVGRVLSVEFVCGRAVRDDSVVITTDIDLPKAAVLTGFIPTA